MVYSETHSTRIHPQFLVQILPVGIYPLRYLLLVTFTVTLAACGGDDGKDGANGTRHARKTRADPVALTATITSASVSTEGV